MFKMAKKRLKAIREKAGRKLAMVFTMATLAYLYAPMQAYALSNNKLFTGTQKLAKDLGTAITGISITVTGAMEAYLFFKKQAAEEDEMKMIMRRQKQVLVAGACVLLASGLVTAILNYYK